MNIIETVPGSYVVATSSMTKKGSRKVRVEMVREFAANDETEARAAFLKRYPDAEKADGFRFDSIRPETRVRAATRAEEIAAGNAQLARVRSTS